MIFNFNTGRTREERYEDGWNVQTPRKSQNKDVCVCVFLQKSPMRSKYHIPMVSPYLYLSIDSYRYKSLFGVPGRKISFGK